MEGKKELYSTKEVERILQRAGKPLTKSRIRQLLRAGELEGERDERRRWYVYRREVHRLLEERRDPSLAGEAGASPEEQESPESAVAWVDTVASLEREFGRLECRLELTERAESTVQEELDQLIRELEEVRAERRRLQEELDNSRRSWWRKLLGR
jgi:vacuolar-type H+-ATPase subunit I/STV1